MATKKHKTILLILLCLFVAQTSYAQFKHDIRDHARLPCLLCHRRENNSPQPTLPGKASHAPCTGCHAQQFAIPAAAFCSICHTDAQSGKTKSFPPLQSFNVKFEHATHTSVGAGCATCHRPSGRGQSVSIPTRMNAHVTCFSCHTPTAKVEGRDISSCGTCHQLGPFTRTSSRATAYRVGFSHEQHNRNEGLSCNNCHRIRAADMTAPQALNHHARARSFSCMSC